MEIIVCQAVALVSQDASLFNDDVAYNIAYGRPDASPEQVVVVS
jgi:ATP-binding cassette subfamily B protein